MTPDEMRKMRKAVPLTQDQLAKAIGYSRMSVGAWERGIYAIPEHVAVKMLEICVGVPLLTKASAPKFTRLSLDTIKYYGQMRRDGFSHAYITKFWHEKNFAPTVDAMVGIGEQWPDILATPLKPQEG